MSVKTQKAALVSGRVRGQVIIAASANNSLRKGKDSKSKVDEVSFVTFRTHQPKVARHIKGSKVMRRIIVHQ